MPFVKKASWEASRSLAARSIQRKWRSRKSDKHIAKVAVKAVMRKAETKSFISANQSRSMTDDFFYYQNIFAPIASGSDLRTVKVKKKLLKMLRLIGVFHIILPLKPLLR